MITPWSSVATGKVDATGAVTITIPGPLVGTDAQATLSLLNVDNSGNWQCTVLGAPIAFNPTGGVSGIFLQGPNTLVVSATGTDLVMDTLVTASLVGGSAPRGEITPSGPLPFPSSSSVTGPGNGTKGSIIGAPVVVTPTSSTNTVNLPITVVSGADVLIVGVSGGPANEISTVTGAGATWSRIAYEPNSTTDSAELWIGTGITAGATTVIVTLSGNSDFTAFVVELEGLKGTVGTPSSTTASSGTISASVTGTKGGAVIALLCAQVSGAVPAPVWASMTSGGIVTNQKTATANEAIPWFVVWPDVSGATYEAAFTITSASALIVAPLL